MKHFFLSKQEFHPCHQKPVEGSCLSSSPHSWVFSAPLPPGEVGVMDLRTDPAADICFLCHWFILFNFFLQVSVLLLLFSYPVMSDSLHPHGLQHMDCGLFLIYTKNNLV